MAISNYLREIKTFPILVEKVNDSEENPEVTDNSAFDNDIDDSVDEIDEDSKIIDNEVLKREIEFLNGELEKERDVSEKNLSKLRYLMADFDNYRKQMQKQVEAKIEENRGQLFIKILKIYEFSQKMIIKK